MQAVLRPSHETAHSHLVHTYFFHCPAENLFRNSRMTNYLSTMRAGHFYEYALQVPPDEKGWRPELGGPGVPEPGGPLCRAWQALLRKEAAPSNQAPSDIGRQRPLARTELLMQPATYGALVENGHNGAVAFCTWLHA